MQLTRLKRLVRLLGVLQSGKPLGISELAESCGVSRRTLFRDLELFRSANLPIEFNEAEHRYSIPDNFFLAPTNFTADEAIAVSLLCQELGSADRLPFQQAAQTAALKLECSLPSALRDLLRITVTKVHIRPAARNLLKGKDDIFLELRKCVSRHRPATIVYDGASDTEISTLLLKPYRLLFSRRSWYVIGYSSIHKEVRTFNIGRIKKVKAHKEVFEIPQRFSLERYLRNAWHLIPEPGNDEQVVVRFSPMVARNVAEVAWHKTQETVFMPDGSLLYRVTVSGLAEISWWILGYGDQAEVLEPVKLQDIVAARAVNMATMYQRIQKDRDKKSAKTAL